MIRTFSNILDRLGRLFNLGIFIEPDSSGQGFFAFEYRGQGTAGREYWGLGLYVVTPGRT